MRYELGVLLTLFLGFAYGCRSDDTPKPGNERIADTSKYFRNDPVPAPPDTTPVPPDTTPIPPDTATENLGVEGAIAVIRDYYAAVNRADYERAYRYWGNDGTASGQTFADFRTGYANTASVDVEIGEPGEIEGAAGSRYVEIPVRITARTREKTEQRFKGSYTLRRTVVEGSSPAQRRWHINSAKIVREH